MRSCFSLLAVFVVLAGCQGPIMTGGFNQSPYRTHGVDGPGPGVIPENYQTTSLPVPVGAGPVIVEAGGPMMAAPCPPPMMGAPMMAAPMKAASRPTGPTSQVNFIGLELLTINWDEKVPGTFDSEPLVCPGTHDFAQGNIYRMKLSNIPGREGKELYPTLEIAPTMARTQAFLAHNSIPIEFTDNDFDQVLSGNFITKVVYLPNPEFQGLAMAGVGTLVNTQLEPGVDPIVEASNRGAILAVIRMGNKDLSGVVAERQRQQQQQHMMPAVMMMGGMPVQVAPQGMPMQGLQYGGDMSAIPQNTISGVNIPAYGTPMTKTSTGIPGPPQLPQGMHSPNRYPVVRAEPIPAPPSVRVGVVVAEPQNVFVNPHYTAQMQMAPPQATQPQVAPQQVSPQQVSPPQSALPQVAPQQVSPPQAVSP